MRMSTIGKREYHFIRVSYQDVEALIREIKSALSGMNIPEGYSVNVYRDVITCCGSSPNNVIVEISGPEEAKIKDYDQRIVSKIIEVCERRGIEHHMLEPFTLA